MNIARRLGIETDKGLAGFLMTVMGIMLLCALRPPADLGELTAKESEWLDKCTEWRDQYVCLWEIEDRRELEVSP